MTKDRSTKSSISSVDFKDCSQPGDGINIIGSLGTYWGPETSSRAKRVSLLQELVKGYFHNYQLK